MFPSKCEIAIIGGGPAGSMTALYLAKSGYDVCLLERRQFPRETLCGEFISSEVIEILKECGLSDQFIALRPHRISKVTISPRFGPEITASLGFDGYGMKRGAFDLLLAEAARKRGAKFIQNADVKNVVRVGNDHSLEVKTEEGEKSLSARWCVAAYGKSSPLDKRLGRGFSSDRSGFNGVKVHLSASKLRNIKPDEIQLYPGRGIYCGVNHVNDGDVALCYLEERSGENASSRGRFRELAADNSHFRAIMTDQAFAELETAPVYGTGNIYFGHRGMVEGGLFMVGDAARVIAPLAGDGIGMALQSAKLLGEVFSEGRTSAKSAGWMEAEYVNRWRSTFSRRVRFARMLQYAMLSDGAMRLGSAMLRGFPGVLSAAVRLTRT